MRLADVLVIAFPMQLIALVNHRFHETLDVMTLDHLGMSMMIVNEIGH